MADEAAPNAPSAGQRVDKWLWFARIIKSRTQAAELVEAGHVRLNRNRIEKPSQLVKAGDVLTVGFGGRVRIVEVRASGVRRGPAVEAQALYTDLTPPAPPREEQPAQHAERDPGGGRPTKRDRRLTDRLRDGE